MAQQQPLSRHQIDKARDDATEALRELRGTIGEAKQVFREGQALLADIRAERERWDEETGREGIRRRIKVVVNQELQLLEEEAGKAIKDAERRIKLHFEGLETALLTGLAKSGRGRSLVISVPGSKGKSAAVRGRVERPEFKLPETE